LSQRRLSCSRSDFDLNDSCRHVRRSCHSRPTVTTRILAKIWSTDNDHPAIDRDRSAKRSARTLLGPDELTAKRDRRTEIRAPPDFRGLARCQQRWGC
jgi:hypothetical protein